MHPSAHRSDPYVAILSLSISGDTYNGVPANVFLILKTSSKSGKFPSSSAYS